MSKLNRKQVLSDLIHDQPCSNLPIWRHSPSINRSASLASKYGVIVRSGDYIEDKLVKLSPDTLASLSFPLGHSKEH